MARHSLAFSQSWLTYRLTVVVALSSLISTLMLTSGSYTLWHFWPGIMNVMMGAVAQYGMAYLPQQFPVPSQAGDAIA